MTADSDRSYDYCIKMENVEGALSLQIKLQFKVNDNTNTQANQIHHKHLKKQTVLHEQHIAEMAGQLTTML